MSKKIAVALVVFVASVTLLAVPDHRLVIDLNKKTVTSTNTVSILEQVPVLLVNITGNNPTDLIFRVIDADGNCMAYKAGFTNAGANAGAIVDFNTSEFTNAFSGARANMKKPFYVGIWNTNSGRLLVNAQIAIQNNPYAPTMPGPNPVGVSYLEIHGSNFWYASDSPSNVMAVLVPFSTNEQVVGSIPRYWTNGFAQWQSIDALTAVNTNALWGSIIGTLTDQSDLVAYITARLASYYTTTEADGLFATGTPLYVETDPMWAAVTSLYYTKTQADLRFATGTPLYVSSAETDPVWTNALSNGASFAGPLTATVFYGSAAGLTDIPGTTETDPFWTNARATGFTMGASAPISAGVLTNVSTIWNADGTAKFDGSQAGRVALVYEGGMSDEFPWGQTNKITVDAMGLTWLWGGYASGSYLMSFRTGGVFVVPQMVVSGMIYHGDAYNLTNYNIAQLAAAGCITSVTEAAAETDPIWTNALATGFRVTGGVTANTFRATNIYGTTVTGQVVQATTATVSALTVSSITGTTIDVNAPIDLGDTYVITNAYKVVGDTIDLNLNGGTLQGALQFNNLPLTTNTSPASGLEFMTYTQYTQELAATMSGIPSTNTLRDYMIAEKIISNSGFSGNDQSGWELAGGYTVFGEKVVVNNPGTLTYTNSWLVKAGGTYAVMWEHGTVTNTYEVRLGGVTNSVTASVGVNVSVFENLTTTQQLQFYENTIPPSSYTLDDIKVAQLNENFNYMQTATVYRINSGIVTANQINAEAIAVTTLYVTNIFANGNIVSYDYVYAPIGYFITANVTRVNSSIVTASVVTATTIYADTFIGTNFTATEIEETDPIFTNALGSNRIVFANDAKIDLNNTNVSIGNRAGNGNVGDYFAALGDAAGYENTGDYVNAIGRNSAIRNNGESVNAIGHSVAYQNHGDYVNAIGDQAASENYGNYVNAIGEQAASFNTVDCVNAIGDYTAFKNKGSNVNAIGRQAAYQNTGDYVNAIGRGAAYKNTGDYVNAIGYYAALFNTNHYCNFLGKFGTTCPSTGPEQTWIAGDLYLADPDDSGGPTSGTKIVLSDGTIFQAGTFATLATGASFGGPVTATVFYGDGSGLTNITGTGGIADLSTVNIASNILIGNVSGTWTISLTNGPCTRYVQTGAITDVVFSASSTNQVFSQRVELQASADAITWPDSITWSAGESPTHDPSARNVFIFDVSDTNVFGTYLTEALAQESEADPIWTAVSNNYVQYYDADITVPIGTHLSTAQIQALIDAQPRKLRKMNDTALGNTWVATLPGGPSVNFVFSNGVYSLTNYLDFTGFDCVRVTALNAVATTNTAQNVVLSNAVNGVLRFNNCAMSTVEDIAIKYPGGGATTCAGIMIANNSDTWINRCYIVGSSTNQSSSGIVVGNNSSAYATLTIIGTAYVGVWCTRGDFYSSACHVTNSQTYQVFLSNGRYMSPNTNAWSFNGGFNL